MCFSVFFFLVSYFLLWLLWPHSYDMNHFSRKPHVPFEVPVTVNMIAVNGIQLEVYEAGPSTGKLMIFLHGYPETAELGWAHQIPFFAKLGYHVVAPNQRGYDKSFKGGVSESNYIKASEDVVALIDHFGAQKAVLVSHDWGGAVAYFTAAVHPEKVEKLVLINIPGLLTFHDYLLTPQIFKSWYMFFFQIDIVSEWKLERDDYSYLIKLAFETSLNQSFSLDELERYKKAWNTAGSLTSMINWYRFFIRDSFPALDHIPRTFKNYGVSGRISVPTLIIWGVQDIYLDHRMAADTLKYLDDGKLIRVDNATHWICHEKPKEVNKYIKEFVEGTK